MKQIISVPDKRLRQKSKPVVALDGKLLDFIGQLTETLVKKDDPPGVGLSAIQVGEPLRLFLTQLPEKVNLPMKEWKDKPLVPRLYLNPEIVKISDKKVLGHDKDKPALEGCLSIPHLWGPVWRHQKIKLQYQTIQGFSWPEDLGNVKWIEEVVEFEEFAARVVQHEIDHLEGILFTDYTLRDKLPLYFDNGDETIEVAEPDKLLTW